MTSGRWFRIAPLESSTPLHTNVVLVGTDVERIAGVERVEATLRHREGVCG